MELDPTRYHGYGRALTAVVDLLALTFDGAVRLRRNVPTPGPRGDEALIRVRTAGICGTDIEITRGYKGFHGTLGHEFVGEVVETGARAWAGQRVCGEINVSCGECTQCRAGLPTHCARREVLGILDRDGAFAEYLVLPTRNLHRVPDALTDDEAVFVEPVAAAYEILEQVPVDPGTAVAVLGDGKLALLCAQVVAGAGANVVLLGKHDERLRLAERLGIPARRSSDPATESAAVVIEATGSPTGLQRAIEMVAPRGTIVLKSTISSQSEADLSAIVVKEITVVGSRCGPFQRAIEGLADGAVQVLPLIAERYSLVDAVYALERAAKPGVLKVLIDVAGQ